MIETSQDLVPKTQPLKATHPTYCAFVVKIKSSVKSNDQKKPSTPSSTRVHLNCTSINLACYFESIHNCSSIFLFVKHEIFSRSQHS